MVGNRVAFSLRGVQTGPMNALPKILAVTVLGFLIFAGIRAATAPASTPAAASSSHITVKAIWLYPYQTQSAGVFSDATIIEKNAACIRFRAGDRVYEHCGHYTIEN